MGEEIEFISPPAEGGRAFSRATRAGGSVYVSGSSAPHDPALGVFRGESAAEQVREALQYVGSALEEAGSGLDRVVHVTMLITDPANYAACNAEYVRHFPGGLPARHTAQFRGADGGQGGVRVCGVGGSRRVVATGVLARTVVG